MTTSNWRTPELVDVNMSAEIGAYQADRRAEQDDRNPDLSFADEAKAAADEEREELILLRIRMSSVIFEYFGTV